MSTKPAALDSTNPTGAAIAHRDEGGVAAITRYLVPVGRVFFALIFLNAIIGHFSSQTIGYAAQMGVPMATLLVPLSGVLAFAGGLSIALGYRARLGAWLVVAFLVPVTLKMHAFWAVTEPMAKLVEQTMFFKNLSMLGAALLIAHFGAGPLSLDARNRKAANG
ncbi:MAG TPA: DoxX family protein [Longimicrobiales bacterium]